MCLPNFIYLTFELVGTTLIGVSVLMVHERMKREHKIDEVVIEEINKERLVTIIGMALIIIGYIVQLLFRC